MLDPPIKIGVLLSLLHVPRERLSEMQAELLPLLEIAAGDDDDWIKAMQQVVKDYAAGNPVFDSLAGDHHAFQHAVAQIQEAAKDFLQPADMLPLETAYLHPKLDEVADVEMAGEPEPHFTLRKQPRLAEDGAQVVYSKAARADRAGGKQPMSRMMSKTGSATGFGGSRLQRRRSSAAMLRTGSSNAMLNRVKTGETSRRTSKILSLDELPVNDRTLSNPALRASLQEGGRKGGRRCLAVVFSRA